MKMATNGRLQAILATFQFLPSSDRLQMNQMDRIQELLIVYQKHGWEMKRLLICPETRDELVKDEMSFAGIRVEDSSLDALWFSRPSHYNREAWELRLVAESNYALFETFEVDESEEAREDVRREMEARMREYVNREPREVPSTEY